MFKRWFFGAFILVFGFVFFVPDSHAGAGLTIRPVKVSHTMNPGEEITGTISLKNAGDEPINVDVTIEDFVPSAGTSNISFVGRAEGLTTVRDWISLDVPDFFQFEIGESKNITYTIKAPEDAEPGGHFGVAFFKATLIDDQGNIKVGTRVGMLIFVTIPGNQLQSGEVLDFEAPAFIQKSPVNFNVKFKNTGTVHFEPKGIIRIRNIFGKEVGSVPIEGQAVLPTGVKDLEAKWETSGILMGRYTAEMKIIDGEGNELTSDSISFYAFPLWYILWFFISIISIFLVLKFLRSHVNISISVNKK